jgi:hypothetical protein
MLYGIRSSGSNYTGNFGTATHYPLIAGSQPEQAAALEALLLFRDPFPAVNTNPLQPLQDPNTRVLVFVRNVQLNQGETASVIVVHLVDSQGQMFDVNAESLWSLTGVDFSQLTFRLPTTLAPGVCSIEVRVHEKVSNVATINIRQ